MATLNRLSPLWLQPEALEYQLKGKRYRSSHSQLSFELTQGGTRLRSLLVCRLLPAESWAQASYRFSSSIARLCTGANGVQRRCDAQKRVVSVFARRKKLSVVMGVTVFILRVAFFLVYNLHLHLHHSRYDIFCHSSHVE